MVAADGEAQVDRAAHGFPVRSVCLDRRLLGLSGGTGVATYAANLARAAASAGWRVETLQDADATDGDTVRRRPAGARVMRWGAALMPWPRTADQMPVGGDVRVATDVFRRAQVHFDLHGRYLQLRGARPPDLMHWSYPLPLRFLGVPNVVTVHDLIPLLQPDLSPVSAKRARRMLTRLRREAAHLVTVSESSRRAIIAELGWPADSVTNTYQSIELPDWTARQAEQAMREATAAVCLSPGGYVLHVGTVERRKNIGRLVAAHRQSGLACPLVLAGPDGWRAGEELGGIGAGAGAGDVMGRVVRIPWLERPALLGLMRGARALLAPSLAEGFGLPAIEAMALGVPVMTSANEADGRPGASAEIAGDAALLVDPRDVRAMAAAILALGSDAGLRDGLAARGRTRAQQFTRETYAGRLRALYADILARAGSRDTRAIKA